MVALPEEARGILKSGHWRKVASSGSQPMYERRVGDGEAILAVSGVGRVRAEAAVREVLDERRPDVVLSLGFAGGLAAGQRAGDMVVARTLMPAGRAPGGEWKPRLDEALHTDRALTDDALRVLATSGLRYQTGACVTTPEIVSRPDAKRRLGAGADALAVDMESYWIGMACRERKAPFLAARAIVDTADRPLPDFIAQSVPDAATGNRWRAAMSAMLHPKSLSDMIRLSGAASAARNSLAVFTEGCLRAWPRPASEPRHSPRNMSMAETRKSQ